MKILSAAKMKELLNDPIIGKIMAQRQRYVDMVWDTLSPKNKNGDPGFELIPRAPDGTMTALQAFNKCRDEKLTFMVESTPFALLGWKSPDDGKTKGPFVVTVWLAVAVEIGENGRFKDMFPAGADCYFPWMEEKKP